MSALPGQDLIASVETLEQVRRLVGENDPDLLISLALRQFNVGEDQIAMEYLVKALAAAPADVRALKLKLFMSVADNDADSLLICRQLIDIDPNDSWVKDMRSKILKEGTESLSLPAIDTRWERLILGK